MFCFNSQYEYKQCSNYYNSQSLCSRLASANVCSSADSVSFCIVASVVQWFRLGGRLFDSDRASGAQRSSCHWRVVLWLWFASREQLQPSSARLSPSQRLPLWRGRPRYVATAARWKQKCLFCKWLSWCDGSDFDWVWDTNSRSTATMLNCDNRKVNFHSEYSCGTAAIRGSKELAEGQHFWEIKMTSPVYGTDMVL